MTEEELAETRARLQRAIARLEENRALAPNNSFNREYIRLSGKIEGVKLALAYLEGH